MLQTHRLGRVGKKTEGKWQINVRDKGEETVAVFEVMADLALVATQSVITEPDGDGDMTLVGHLSKSVQSVRKKLDRRKEAQQTNDSAEKPWKIRR